MFEELRDPNRVQQSFATLQDPAVRRAKAMELASTIGAVPPELQGILQGNGQNPAMQQQQPQQQQQQAPVPVAPITQPVQAPVNTQGQSEQNYMKFIGG